MTKSYQFLLIALIFSFGISKANAAPEEIIGTNLSVDFAESVLSGAGTLIRATNIPVQSAGTTVYYDVELDFKLLPGNIFGAQLISATPSSGPVSPTSVSTMNFMPGTYAGIAPGSPASALPCFLSLSEPSIGADGRRTYVLTVTSNATGCPAGVTSYTWQTGPAENNGIIAGFGRPGTTFVNGSSLTFAYGMSSNSQLFRALQIEDTLTINVVRTTAQPLGDAFTLVKQ